MDLLFKKYASPFLLLDGMISTGRFCEFINEFLKINDEDQKWEFYLNKVEGKSYAEFLETIETKERQKSFQKVSKQQAETTIKNSYDILNGFIPHQ